MNDRSALQHIVGMVIESCMKHSSVKIISFLPIRITSNLQSKDTFPSHIRVDVNLFCMFRTLSKDGMHLYRHSTRCRAAVQMFLDENPRYWRFVPMTDEEASQPHETILSASAEIQSSADIRDDPLTKLFIENLPSAPTGYRYSQRQYHLQQVFFKSKRDLDVPNVHLDLYNAKIIAVRKCPSVWFFICRLLLSVVPETGSTVLRQLVEALFITHAETKLNSSGRLVSTTDNHDAAINQESTIWCEGLVRRPVPTFTINMARSSAAVTTTPARPVKVEPRQE